ncbi:MAG: LysE family translocator [Anaerolineales bacterium]|nr:LysE family translocator [Anaerolineales bacterium]
MVLPARLFLFIISALILLLTPGPAVLYIITRSVDQGRKAGMASVLGVELGNSVHVLAATLGLSAILLTSALAFNIVKYVGAAYLIYLGVRTLLRPATLSTEAESEVPAPKNLGRIFRQGMVVATLNPKTALFFLAYLPQFVDVSKGHVSQQFLLLGFLFVAMAVVTDSIYALLSGTAGSLLKRSVWFGRFQRYVAGTIYIGLGLTAAVGGEGHK